MYVIPDKFILIKFLKFIGNLLIVDYDCIICFIFKVKKIHRTRVLDYDRTLTNTHLKS